MAWRLARCLERLRAQVNAAAPNRDKSADGTIGDTAHSSRTSDHNPNPDGVVCAIDITHDPDGGLDSYALAETLKARADKRIKYIISNGRIWNPTVASGWRKYSGSNPHSHHVHVSVKSTLADDKSDWQIGLASKGILERAIVVIADTIAPPPPKYPTLKRGDKGEEVRRIQRLLDFAAKDIDGDFGRRTEAAVKAFQRSKKLVADGLVGTYTWKALGA